MNTNDLLLRWSTMTLDEIEEEIRSAKDEDSARRLLGDQTVNEIQQDAPFAGPADFIPDPVVLLPGIMGSLLMSIRGVTTLVWINPLVFLEGKARYLKLSEDWSQDGTPEVEMMPVGLEKITYLRMELAFNKCAEFYEFPYDWRRPIEYNAGVLHNTLERWAAGTDKKFNLVAHSMGGQVSRAYMALFPKDAEKRVRRLVMMGTPNFGSTNAVETLFTGNSLMDTVDKLNASNQMTEVVRRLPGVYNLLPAPPEFLPSGRSAPVSWDLYDGSAWKSSWIQPNLLANTRALYQKLFESDPQIPIAQVAGCNMSTLVGIKADLGLTPVLNRVVETEGPNAGDGTVPLWSSLLPKADIFYIQEKHGSLPANGQVIQAVKCIMQGQAVNLPTELPAPKTFLGFMGDGEVPSSPEELRAKIRSGTAGKDDLEQLNFAL